MANGVREDGSAGVIKLIEYIHSQLYLSALEAIKLIEFIHSPLNPKGLASHR